MNITFEQLRQIKHQLPSGSVKRIARELQIEEQTVRNYFGANKYENSQIIGRHLQAGPHGGIVNIDDTRIFDLANRIIKETQINHLVSN